MKDTTSIPPVMSLILASLRHPRFAVALISGLAMPAANAVQPPTDSSPEFDLSTNASFSTGGDLERDGVAGVVGEVEVARFEFEAGIGFRHGEEWRFRVGAYAHATELEFNDTAVPLPDTLDSYGLSLAATKFFGGPAAEQWRATLMLRPGVSSDSSGSSDDGFNVPVIMTLGNRVGRTFSWDVGFRFDANSDDELLPVIGVQWDFRPEWKLSVGFPRTEVSYRLAERWTLKGGLRYQAGTYHVETALAPGLDDTYLEYREIRVGGGVEWRLNDTFTMHLDGGLVADRSFDYFERDYELQGDSAAYFSFGLSARF